MRAPHWYTEHRAQLPQLRKHFLHKEQGPGAGASPLTPPHWQQSYTDTASFGKLSRTVTYPVTSLFCSWLPGKSESRLKGGGQARNPAHMAQAADAARPVSTSSDGSAVLVGASGARHSIDGAAQLDEDEDAMLSALLGGEGGEEGGEAAGAPHESEFAQTWERDMQAYLTRCVAADARVARAARRAPRARRALAARAAIALGGGGS